MLTKATNTRRCGARERKVGRSANLTTLIQGWKIKKNKKKGKKQKDCVDLFGQRDGLRSKATIKEQLYFLAFL